MDCYEMLQKDKDTLRSNRIFLRNNIGATTELLDYLLSKRVITDDMKEEVQVEKLSKDKVSRLLDILVKRGPLAFRELVLGLLESEQPYPARMLDEALVREWESGHAEQRSQEPSERQGQQPTERQGQQPTEQQGQQPTEQQGQQPTEQQGQQPTEQQGQQPTEQQGQQPTEQRGQQPTEQQGQQPTERQGQQLLEEQEQPSTEEQNQVPTEEQGQSPLQESTSSGQPSSAHSNSEDETDKDNSEKPIMDIGIHKVDHNDPSIAALINSPDVYPMRSRPRGRALIINNNYFVRGKPRDGAKYDVTNLNNLFTKLGFHTSSDNNDLTANQMRHILKEESQHKDHRTADCFVLFVLSHGSHGSVYGTDAKPVSIVSDIVSQFDGEHCEALVDKPKIIFIQACQGDSATQRASGPQLQADDVAVSDITQAVDNLSIQDTDDSLPSLSHKMSDIVLAYSTVPGYKSWRHPELGSWFVRALVDVFSADAHKEDLINMLIKVRRRVANDQRYHRDASFQQLTRTDETTQRKLFFFPGYHHT